MDREETFLGDRINRFPWLLGLRINSILRCHVIGRVEGNTEGGSGTLGIEEFIIFFKKSSVLLEIVQSTHELFQNWGFIIQVNNLNSITRNLREYAQKTSIGTFRDQIPDFLFWFCSEELGALMPSFLLNTHQEKKRLNNQKLSNYLQVHQISKVTGQVSPSSTATPKERDANIVSHSLAEQKFQN